MDPCPDSETLQQMTNEGSVERVFGLQGYDTVGTVTVKRHAGRICKICWSLGTVPLSVFIEAKNKYLLYGSSGTCI